VVVQGIDKTHDITGRLSVETIKLSPGIYTATVRVSVGLEDGTTRLLATHGPLEFNISESNEK
jgi:hypothetical protein